MYPHPYFENGRWGYIDNWGQVVIRPQFDWAKDFFEDRAAVRSPERSGYIRPDGSWAVVLPKGDFPSMRFTQGRAWFLQSEHFGCVDSEGRIVIRPIYDWAEEFSEGVAVVNTGHRKPYSRGVQLGAEERYGFVDLSGQVILPLQYVNASRFSDGLARTRRPGIDFYEYIDHTGKVAFSLEGLRPDPRCYVGYASESTNERATVWFDGSPPAEPFAVFIDTGGQIIGSQLTYENAGLFSEGLAWVKIHGKVGYVDTMGRLVIPARFDKGGDFHEGRCRVLVGKAWEYIERHGDIVAKGGNTEGEAWNDVEDFYGGLARVHTGGEFVESNHGPAFWRGGKWSYIDLRGTVVSVCRNDEDRLIVPPLGKEHDARPH